MQNHAKIKCEITVDKKINVPLGTVARIASSDIMGTKVVELVISDSPYFHVNGDMLFSDSEESLKDQVSVQLLPLKQKLEDLLQSVDNAMKIVRGVFDNSTQQNIRSSFASFNNTFNNLQRISATIDNTIKEQEKNINLAVQNISRITSTINESNTDIKGILKNMNSASKLIADAPISETIINLDQTVSMLNNFVKKIETGEGTLGKLSVNDSLYNSLKQLVNNMDELSIDIKTNPKRYINVSVFGRDKR